ncbi:MAG: Hsp20/alpha crystallin family protein, partial [Pirellulaceae bacterium]|nr:Hsp20/alpha crystallin family protein [Pirellulaceae bacterium]
MIDKLVPWKRSNHRTKYDGSDLSVSRLRHDFDDLWDQMTRNFKDGLIDWRDGKRAFSQVEFDESNNKWVLTAELPGYEPEDIDLKLSGNVITIRAEHIDEGSAEGKKYHRKGSFVESFTLPNGVREDDIVARYRNGILEVDLPKSEEVQGKRIEV